MAELKPGTCVRLLDPRKHAPRVRKTFPSRLFGQEVVLDDCVGEYWPCGEAYHLVEGYNWPDKAMEVVTNGGKLTPRKGPKAKVTCHRDGTVSFFNTSVGSGSAPPVLTCLRRSSAGSRRRRVRGSRATSSATPQPSNVCS